MSLLQNKWRLFEMDKEYDLNYSLTKEETDKMYEWRKKHNKKFHKRGFGYRGVSPVSNFEVRFGSCSIGMWCECVCLNCLDKVNSEDTKKAEDIRKSAIYTIREL